MKLFKYEGYEVRVAPEALLLKPFRKVWDRDKSKGKERAMQEMAFLYFYCDPKSDYQYIADDEDRLEAVIRGQGFPSDWKPDATLMSAIVFYRSFDSSSAMLLRMINTSVEKLKQKMEDMDLSETDEKGKPLISVKEYTATIKEILRLVPQISEVERALNSDSDAGEARGSIEKGMFEDGLDDVADYVRQHSNNP